MNPKEHMTPEILQGMLKTSLETLKCRKCGCMKETLLTMEGQLTVAVEHSEGQARGWALERQASVLLDDVKAALSLMEPIEYT